MHILAKPISRMKNKTNDISFGMREVSTDRKYGNMSKLRINEKTEVILANCNCFMIIFFSLAHYLNLNFVKLYFHTKRSMQ